MFSLQLERGKYVRVRGGVTAKEISDAYKTPVVGKVYAGAIVEIADVSDYCYAKAGDCYETIAKRYGCDLDKLRRVNADAPVYPTKRVWIP